MTRMSTVSPTSIRLRGKQIPGAEDRQGKIPGFDQSRLCTSRIVCIGAGGLISHIAPALARKGVGALTILDDDIVEVSNLNRQRFYETDIRKNKAIALAQNLQRECIFSIGYDYPKNKKLGTAIFPPQLIEIPILAGCPKEGVVLDPFMGSGTTAIVALKLGRKFVGIELNPAFVEMANERIATQLGCELALV